VKTLTTIIDYMYNEFNDLRKSKKLEIDIEDEAVIKQVYMSFFVFGHMWSFGAALPQEYKTGYSNMVRG